MNTARTAAALPRTSAFGRITAAAAGALLSTLLLGSVVVGMTGMAHDAAPVVVAKAAAPQA